MENIEQVMQNLDSQPEVRFEESTNRLLLLSHHQKFFDYAVQTKQCKHFSKPVELQEILQQRKCSECNLAITSANDLIKSPTEWALTYFSENPNDIKKRKQCKTQQCCVVAGYYFHYYYRNSRFYKILQSNDDLIKLLMDNRNDQNNFLQLCRYDQKIKDLPQGHLYSYQPVCLLDSCKINIPVRHKNCRHPECYELSSLLQYAAEIVQTELNGNGIKVNKQMKCCQENCRVEFKMEFNDLGSDLVLDYELLTALRQSPAYCLNFNVSTQTFTLKNDFSQNDGYDRYIQIYHQQKKIQKNLELFQSEILKSMTNYLQTDDKIQEFQIKNKFRIIKNINLKDPFISNVIEYPSRCIKCPLNVCADLRIYLCEILTTLKADDSFQCPLCKHKFSSIKVTQTNKLNQNIYVDFNLQQQLIKFPSHRNELKFDYLGDQYLLQEFIKRAQSKDVLQQLHLQKGLKTIEYTNLNCVQSKKRLNHPLKLPNCVQNNYISFQTLYDKIQDADFDYSKAFTFCSCSYCIQNPISMKKIQKDFLIYEPLFQDALEQLSRQGNQNVDKIAYDVEQCQLVGKTQEDILRKSQTIHQPINNQAVYIPMITDIEYDKLFEKQMLQGKYSCQIKQVKQNIGGCEIIHQQGKEAQDNIKQRKEEINKSLANDELFKQYKIQFTSIKIESGNKTYQG